MILNFCDCYFSEVYGLPLKDGNSPMELVSLYNQSVSDYFVDYDLIMALLHLICACREEGKVSTNSFRFF